MFAPTSAPGYLIPEKLAYEVAFAELPSARTRRERGPKDLWSHYRVEKVARSF